MLKNKVRVIFSVLLMFWVGNIMAADVISTGLLTLEPGFVGEEMAVEVVAVEFDSEQGYTKITLTIPLSEYELGAIQVKSAKDDIIPQLLPYKKIENNSNNDKVGVVIYVGKSLKLPIRLYFDTAGQ
ncbi:hypothetical protein NO559_09185 [Dasania sp. GY-MA-18]|uniref:Uncharacterized protein n=1 Tax=Dasania phycosphaerae TaxID=2950436 RepID=A0A9J6RMG1_9GAMM|nr:MULTISPECIES: hypothetical protein [Dasania]MCR8922945.1 hypothetical protein [Dasania sp. GY-MA-18]MCZ0865376.1 hypothetical protein [Dasania phycosphaerae]MCZ0869101.1 hypothetical protein [Dasania phycosphaerae]